MSLDWAAITVSDSMASAFGAVILTAVVGLMTWMVKILIELQVSVTKIDDHLTRHEEQLQEIEAEWRRKEATAA